MDAETMHRAIQLEHNAKKLREQHDKYVLLRRDSYTKPEIINAGDPFLYKEKDYHRVEIPIPDEARRYIFALWKREIALKYNSIVRELNQIGMTTDLRPLSIERPHP